MVEGGLDSERVDGVPNESSPKDRAIAELPKAFPDRDEAIALAARAGFPRDRLPPFTTNAQVFWDRAVFAAQSGAMVGGVRALLAAAAKALPGNEAFAPFAAGQRDPIPELAPGSVSARLGDAYREREELTVAGEDTTEVDSKILELRRKLRHGPTLKPGEFLGDGRFRLIEVVGSGGFARVWKAYDRRRQCLVAVKVLHGQFAADQSRRERLFRGARQMAKLNHPNVVRVLAPWGQEQGFYYYVMEYVGGGDLYTSIINRLIDLEQALGVIEAIAGVLEIAHRHGLVHRDIKPQNILLHEDGRPVLSDFDLVRAVGSTGGTRTGAMGTFIYAAPEQNEDASRVDHRADIYSLGMTAVFCVYGKKLPKRALIAHEAFLSSLGCERLLRSALQKAAAIEAQDRFGDMAAFRSAIAGAQKKARKEADSRSREKIARKQYDSTMRLRHAETRVLVKEDARVVAGEVRFGAKAKKNWPKWLLVTLPFLAIGMGFSGFYIWSRITLSETGVSEASQQSEYQRNRVVGYADRPMGSSTDTDVIIYDSTDSTESWLLAGTGGFGHSPNGTSTGLNTVPPSTSDGREHTGGNDAHIVYRGKPKRRLQRPRSHVLDDEATDALLSNPEALLNEARQKQYKEPADAYRLARQAYTAKPSSAALWVMGPTACRLKDKSKATWVLKRLKMSDKTKLKDICANKGLEL